MQLPRGTFRLIHKGVRLGGILGELAASRFTGISSLSSLSINGTLVFRGGECVLAKIQTQYGDPAWEIVISQPDMVTDIALSDLNNAQLQLALDFNKKALVAHPKLSSGKSAESPPAGRATLRPDDAVKHGIQTRYEQKEREFIKTSGAARSVPPVSEPAERPRTRPKGAKEQVPPQIPEHQAQAVPGEDMDAIDNLDIDLDLEDVTKKIRKDCKLILKQLQLDHLTEK
jgi:hypothetical protein